MSVPNRNSCEDGDSVEVADEIAISDCNKVSVAHNVCFKEHRPQDATCCMRSSGMVENDSRPRGTRKLGLGKRRQHFRI
jgi:hypothetical protein